MTSTHNATPTAASDTPSNVSFDRNTGKTVTLTLPVYDPGPVDAEYGPQWHLGYLGDLASVWQDYTGRGVKVGLFDDGVQSWHWDLAPNYDAANNLNINGWVIDGSWGGRITAPPAPA